MTQKELLYVEDAIGHECAIIKILEDSAEKVENEDISSYFKSQINNHMQIKENLINLLEEKQDE